MNSEKDVYKIYDHKVIESNLQKIVANIAHEFRTPISLILGYIDLVKDGVAGEVTAKQIEYLKKAREKALSLNEMVSAILNMATVVSGKVQIRRRQIETSDYIKHIIESLTFLAKEKAITLDVVVPQKIAPFWGDPNRLEQCITNLVGNAIKFAENNSEIMIAVNEEKDKIRFEVKDEGIGMTEEEMATVFDRFERNNSDSIEGAGLGLAITKEIIDQHNGKIWVESKTGEGSKFIFELPKDPRKDRVPS
jgi:signal transduction histidine kinase